LNLFHIENLAIPVPIIQRGMGIVISLSESIPAITNTGRDSAVSMIRYTFSKPGNKYQLTNKAVK